MTLQELSEVLKWHDERTETWNIKNSNLYSMVLLLKPEYVTPYCLIFNDPEKRLIARVHLNVPEVKIELADKHGLGESEKRKIKEHCEANKKAMVRAFNHQNGRFKC